VGKAIGVGELEGLQEVFAASVPESIERDEKV
jgi:hypothetical protein